MTCPCLFDRKAPLRVSVAFGTPGANHAPMTKRAVPLSLLAMSHDEASLGGRPLLVTKRVGVSTR